MSDQQKYIGITLGPIGRTLAKADKTREFWGASYLFSYLSRQIIESLLKAGFTADEIVNPSPVGLPLSSSDQPGVGLYSDQIFLQTTDLTAFAKVQQVITNCKQTLTSLIIDSIHHYRGYDLYANLFKKRILSTRREELEQYLLNYFQVYSVEIDKATCLNLKMLNEKGEEKQLRWFAVVKYYLEHLEMRQGIAHFDPDPIKVFLRGINHSFLIRDAFKRPNFDSFYGISTVDLRFAQQGQFREEYDKLFKSELEEAISAEKAAVLDEQMLASMNDEAYAEQIFHLEQLKEESMLDQIAAIEGIKPFLRGYHRYIAIVHADIDHLGEFIGYLSPAEMQSLTSSLIEFSKATNTLIAGKKYTDNDRTEWGYGAAPVYIGGDDLVFFAPVVSRTQEGGFKSIFNLLREIDQLFDQIVGSQVKTFSFELLTAEEKNEVPQLSISYGVSISYVKYPLQEAYARSEEILQRVKAKKGAQKARNVVSFELRKHSGQVVGATFSKKDQQSTYDDFLSLIAEYGSKNSEDTKDETFLNSFTHGLEWFKSALLSFPSKDLEVPLRAFFAQTFNEPIHQQEEYKTYLERIQQYLLKLQQTDSTNPYLNREAQFSNLYGALRFIHFIREHDYE